MACKIGPDRLKMPNYGLICPVYALNVMVFIKKMSPLLLIFIVIFTVRVIYAVFLFRSIQVKILMVKQNYRKTRFSHEQRQILVNDIRSAFNGSYKLSMGFISIS